MTNSIPYIKQSADRTCGAASLSMVYASLGLQVSQDEIWSKIAKNNSAGNLSSTTHLMARDVIERGFDAVVLQAQSPLRAIHLCKERGVRVIINHRAAKDSTAGHYSVLLDLSQKSALLHDPSKGPSVSIGLVELMELWRAGPQNSETLGNVMIAIAPRQVTGSSEIAQACAICESPIPRAVTCPSCQRPVPLSPQAVLGCVHRDCHARIWNCLCCPECDGLFEIQTSEKPVSAKKKAAEPPSEPFDLEKLYKEIDKFFGFARRFPDLMAHEEFRKQMDFVYSQKEVLRMALLEQEAHQKQRDEEIEAFKQRTAADAEALRQQREEAAREGPPIDGDALAMDLFVNLGFLLRRTAP